MIYNYVLQCDIPTAAGASENKGRLRKIAVNGYGYDNNLVQVLRNV